MPASTQKKSGLTAGCPAATRLFEQLGNLFASTPATKAPSLASETLEAAFNAFKQAPYAEVVAVRKVLALVCLGFDRILPAVVPDAEWQAAVNEDVRVQKILADTRAKQPATDLATNSDAEAAAFMAEMREGSAAALQRRIADKALLTAEEFQTALKVRRRFIIDAMKVGRLFALVGPSGENYYPAFYSDAGLDRRSVEKVAKALGQLPSASKYFFFTSKSIFLGGVTPLDALKNGRLADVSAAAAGFAEG